MARAEARDVVATRGQLSDAARALWLPIFYRQVAKGADRDEALFQVSRQLRGNRHSHHAFCWAAFLHQGHL